MPDDSYFIDTNLLLYTIDTRDPAKQQLANNWMDFLWLTDTGRLSWQVLNEYYSNAVRKFGAPPKEIRGTSTNLLLWQPGGFSPHLMLRAWHWTDAAQLTHWDALILASAELQGCRWLLSEDFQHGRLYGNVEIINPFLTPPPTPSGTVRH